VAPGAFADSIKDIRASGRPLPVLWNHNSDEPIGKYLDLEEDDRGLKVRGQLLTGSVARAKEIAAMIEAGIISGLSIGYYVKGYSIDEETRIWTLTKLKLREISVVTFPANDEARIETVKAKLAAGGQLTKREFEKLLRDAGFSKTESLRITRDGYSAYTGERDAADQTALKAALAELRDALSTH
jgi:HK97 family phage prohead protease